MRLMLSLTPFSFKTILLLLGLALLLELPCRADPTDTEDAEFARLQSDAKKSFKEGVDPFVKAYCIECHGDRKRKAGLNYQLAVRNPGSASSRKAWKMAVDTVMEHEMPPEEEKKHPTDDERQKLEQWIGKIKYLSPKDPGPFVIRRLTRVEYGNTLRDLYGVDPSVTAALPDEVFGEGYLNTFSPLQSEQYLGIANDVLNRVLAPAGAPPTAVQKKLFGEAPAPGADLRTEAKKSRRNSLTTPTVALLQNRKWMFC